MHSSCSDLGKPEGFERLRDEPVHPCSCSQHCGVFITSYLIAQCAVRRARARRAPWTNRKAKAKQPQMEKRTSIKSKWTSGKRTSTRKAKQNTKTASRNRKLAPRRLSMAPQEAKNRFKKGRRGCKNDPKSQVEPRSAPRPPQDRPGTPPRGDSHLFPSPRGDHLGAQKRPKTEPKTIQNQSENREAHKSDPRGSRTRLGAILVALGAPCGSPETPKVLENVIFRANSLFRR